MTRIDSVRRVIPILNVMMAENINQGNVYDTATMTEETSAHGNPIAVDLPHVVSIEHPDPLDQTLQIDVTLTKRAATTYQRKANMTYNV